MKNSIKKISKEKIKEINLVIFAFVLVGIGYVNFANKDNTTLETYAKSTNSLGDVELVSSNAILVENDSQNELSKSINTDNNISNEIQDEYNQDIKNKSEEEINHNKETEEVNSKDSINTSKSEILNYFSEVKLNRDIMYDEILETYQKMIDSSTISNEQKSIAVQEIEKITKQKKSISIAEELIKLKGFENVAILANDDIVNVIVRIAVLNKEQVVQIQNIVTKELGVEVQNISISTK